MRLLRLIKENIFSLKYHCKNKPIIIGKVIVRGNPKIILGKNVRLFNNVILWGDGEIILEDNVAIGDNCILNTNKNGGIKIGKDTMVAANCYIIDSNHSHCFIDKPYMYQGIISKRIIIGSNCWIGANSTLVPGTKINNNCIIGANSFVNCELEESTISAGLPARIIALYNVEQNKWDKVPK